VIDDGVGVIVVVESIILVVLETPFEGTREEIELDETVGMLDDGVVIKVLVDVANDVVLANDNGGMEVNVVILVSDVGGATDDSVVKVNVVFVVT